MSQLLHAAAATCRPRRLLQAQMRGSFHSFTKASITATMPSAPKMNQKSGAQWSILNRGFVFLDEDERGPRWQGT